MAKGKSFRNNPALAFISAIPETAPEAPRAGAETIVELPLAELHGFTGHPFGVADDAEMQNMVKSIREHGVLTPAIVRARDAGGYELVSGHRRKRGSELAGKDTLPCIVRDMDDNTAVILMVDSNYQRENVKLSEKARALKMKLDAIKRQGERTDLTSVQNEQKLPGKVSRKLIAEQAGESEAGVQRLLRLNELVPELLAKVDAKKIGLMPAVELSYLPQKEQALLAVRMSDERRGVSLAQAQRIRKLSAARQLNKEAIGTVLAAKKADAKPDKVLVLKGKRLEKYFTDDYTAEVFEDVVFKALEAYFARQKG